MRCSRMRALLAVSIFATSAVSEAQRPESAPARRQALEQRVRQQMAVVVQQRLGLNADQMRRLGDVNRDMEAERRVLNQQERDVRIGLRAEVMRGDSANQDRVARYVDQLIDVQRRRIELLSREQRALAAFMTPTQRAQYLAIQDQVRKRMEDMRGRRRGGGPARRGDPARDTAARRP
ncbi:MAG TPA: hypothetical protein VJ650_07485 [Gemmatimonadaceae bacterium]|nr:hypothetical protein [Gemmatimonadaceae bacterium]